MFLSWNLELLDGFILRLYLESEKFWHLSLKPFYSNAFEAKHLYL